MPGGRSPGALPDLAGLSIYGDAQCGLQRTADFPTSRRDDSALAALPLVSLEDALYRGVHYSTSIFNCFAVGVGIDPIAFRCTTTLPPPSVNVSRFG